MEIKEANGISTPFKKEEGKKTQNKTKTLSHCQPQIKH